MLKLLLHGYAIVGHIPTLFTKVQLLRLKRQLSGGKKKPYIYIYIYIFLSCFKIIKKKTVSFFFLLLALAFFHNALRTLACG